MPQFTPVIFSFQKSELLLDQEN